MPRRFLLALILPAVLLGEEPVVGKVDAVGGPPGAEDGAFFLGGIAQGGLEDRERGRIGHVALRREGGEGGRDHASSRRAGRQRARLLG